MKKNNTDKLTFDARKGRWVSTDPETDGRLEKLCKRPSIAALMVAGPLGVKAAVEEDLKTS